MGPNYEGDPMADVTMTAMDRNDRAQEFDRTHGSWSMWCLCHFTSAMLL
jgi:hypothetical protein